MSALLGLFSSKATWVVAVAILIATILGVQHARITHLKSVVADRDATIAVSEVDLRQAKEINARWKDAYSKLDKTLVEQNAQIALFEEEAKLRFEHAQLAMRLAAQNREGAEKLAQTIIRMELANDECKAMRQLVDASRAGGLR